jgi:hypothetical protein
MNKEEAVGIRLSRSPAERGRESDGVIVLLILETAQLWRREGPLL